MLTPEVEQEVRDQFARVGGGVEVPPGLAERLISRRHPRRHAPRLLVGTAALVLLVGALLVAALVPANHPSTNTAVAHHLGLRLVDDQVALVAASSLSTAATISALSCSSASNCLAVGSAAGPPEGFVAATSDGGTTWNQQLLPAGVTHLRALACLSADHCVAVGNRTDGPVLLGSSDGGRTWRTLTYPTDVRSLASVSCAARRCWAVGSTGGGAAVLLSGADDTPWAATPLPIKVTALSAIGCTAGRGPATCMAVGSARSTPVALVSISGAPWTALSLPSGVQAVASAACTGPAAPACTTLVERGGSWVEETRFVAEPGQAGEWHGPEPTPNGAEVAQGTVMAGVSTCIAVGGPPCTPSNADMVNTVTSVISQIGGRHGAPSSLNESLTSGYVADQPSFSRAYASSSDVALSPVWYVGVSPSGFSANEVLSSGQRTRAAGS
jgi:hypothetical protein